jgi:hypothetical protein
MVEQLTLNSLKALLHDPAATCRTAKIIGVYASSVVFSKRSDPRAGEANRKTN